MKHRIREHTYNQKQYVINKKLLPYFGKLPLCEITPAAIRKWQNELISYREENDKPYSETYLKTINNQLSAIMICCQILRTAGKSMQKSWEYW